MASVWNELLLMVVPKNVRLNTRDDEVSPSLVEIVRELL
jgi:hypothetical protein